ncbi:MAG: hypothetical protein ACJ73D_05880 [Pyrinomonadaceae bacterium]
MKKLLMMIGITVMLTGAAYSQGCRDIRFAKGHSSAVVDGLTTKHYVCYRIRARSGQTITLHLDSPDPKVKFSMTQDYFDADFTAEDVRDWEGQTGDVDGYLISVGGSRAGTKFSLSVAIR